MQIIDRRSNQKNKSTVNRQRFIRRYKKQIKQAITKQIAKRGVTDIDKNESVSIPSKDINEPTFRSGDGGQRERGSGRRASDSGEGEDEFSFEISSDEYMEMLFEDLELPNLKKNQLKKIINYKPIRSGFNTDGTPSNIDIVRLNGIN